jgi:tetratricopeptide (TPR) repeat protein
VGRLTLVRLLSLWLLARIAHADGVDSATQAKADVFFEKGQQDYQSNKFQAAIQLFQDAYELVHDPIYLFNIAQSYRKAADCQNASDYYNRYLSESPDAPNKQAVQGWLRELAPCVQQQKQRQLDAAHRAEELARVRHDEGISRTAPVERDDGQGLRVAGLTIGGIGVAGVVVGIVSGVQSHDLQREVELACTTSCDYAQVKSLDDQGKRANTIALAGYIGGGAAILAGVGLYVFGMTKVEHVTVAPAPGGATVGASWRF